MKQICSKETVVIVLLTVLTVVSIGNFVRAQQPGPITSGFWFMRRKPVPEHVKEGAKHAVVMEINRLTLLTSIPLGDTDVTDYVGNPITWDQSQLDAVIAEITRLQLTLDEFQ